MLRLLFIPLLIAFVSTEEPAKCQITLELVSCSGEPKSDIELAVLRHNSDGELVRLRSTTDVRGIAQFPVCAEDILEVEIYIIEDAPPVGSQPIFEVDNPTHGKVLLC